MHRLGKPERCVPYHDLIRIGFLTAPRSITRDPYIFNFGNSDSTWKGSRTCIL